VKKYQDTSKQETISEFAAEMMSDEKDGEEFTREYLQAKFLSSIGRSLYYARRKAGLTQAQVAERMNTKQSVIARYEADENGSISFRRYVDFAIACGMMPRSLMIEPILEEIHTLRDEMINRARLQHLQEPLHVRYCGEVEAFTFDSLKVQFGSNSALPVMGLMGQPLTDRDGPLAVETANNLVKQLQQPFHGENVTTAISDLHASTLADNKRKLGA